MNKAKVVTFLFLSFAGLKLFAVDELRFKNGDRIRGKLLEKKEGQIIFESQILGKITVAEQDVTIVNLETEKSAETATAGGEVAAALATTEEKKKEEKVEEKPPVVVQAPPEKKEEPPPPPAPVVANRESESAALPQVAEVKPEEPPPPSAWSQFVDWCKVWNNRLNVSYLWRNEPYSENNEYAFKFWTDRKFAEKHRVDAYAEYFYSRREDSNGNKYDTANKVYSHGNYAYDFSKYFYTRYTAKYWHDEISNLNYQLEQIGGIGWKIWEGPILNASISPGLVYRVKKYSGRDTETDYPINIQQNMTIFLLRDLKWSMLQELKLEQSFSFNWDAKESDDWDYRLNVNLFFKVNTAMDLTLGFQQEYNARSNDPKKSTERLTSGLTFRF